MTDMEKYREEMRSVRPRDSFKQETIALLREHDRTAQMNDFPEVKYMNRKLKTAVAVIIAVLMLTGSVFAAARLLSADEAADTMGAGMVAEAFRSEDAVLINESRVVGEYSVTLLGFVSGDDIFNEATGDDADSIIAVSLERTDGQPVSTDDGCPLALVPVVDGYAPWSFNGYTLNACGVSRIENGVMYYLFSCDDLEKFSDHRIRLAVFEGFAPSSDIFAIDCQTGVISFCDSYEGAGTLFDMPIDSSKADAEAAARLLRELGYEIDENGAIVYDTSEKEYDDYADDTDEADVSNVYEYTDGSTYEDSDTQSLCTTAVSK